MQKEYKENDSLNNNSSSNNYYELYNIYIKDLEKYELLTVEEEKDLTKKYYETRDPALKEKIINANLRLVVSIAKKINNDRTHFLDLIQEGNIGLMTAVDKFDPNMGIRFSSYASLWIVQKMRIYKQRFNSIKIPNFVLLKIVKLKEYEDKYYSAKGRAPKKAEILRDLNITDEEYDTIKKANYCLTANTLSLHNPIMECEDYMLIDSIEDRTSGSLEENALNNIEQQDIADTVSTVLNKYFNDKQIDIIKMRYGMKPYYRKCTLQEAGDKYNITRERVRQIEKRTLERLKQKLSVYYKTLNR